ncbi:hypothetical protein [Streptomyces sp. NPDC048419]|uniref:hypothetical protein n=1 Tax=Streptomyces sp. NPDC048419 TaxID=3365547 RepID=UPI003713EE5B
MVLPGYGAGRAAKAIARARAAARLAAAKAAAGPWDSAVRPVTATARPWPPTIALVANATASARREGITARSMSPNTVIRCGALATPRTVTTA